MLINHPKVSVSTESHVLKGFDTISIQKSLGSLYSEFSLNIADRRLKDAAIPVQMREKCHIKVGDHLLDTGYIDHMGHWFSKEGSFFEIYGRSLSCDVDESCIELLNNEFKGTQEFKTIADKLLKPFKISLSVHSANKNLKLKDWKIEPGERVGENLFRAAKKLDILLYGLPNGNIAAGKINSAMHDIPTITQGVNLIHAHKYTDYTQLYGKYVVKSNAEIEDEITTISGSISNPNLPNSRVLILSYDGLASEDECKALAKWEMMIRQGNSFQFSVKIPGWINSQSLPWELNTLVDLDCERIKTKERLLITEIHMEYSKEEGHITYLELRYPNSMMGKPFLETSQQDDKYSDLIKSLGY